MIQEGVSALALRRANTPGLQATKWDAKWRVRDRASKDTVYTLPSGQKVCDTGKNVIERRTFVWKSRNDRGVSKGARTWSGNTIGLAAADSELGRQTT